VKISKLNGDLIDIDPEKSYNFLVDDNIQVKVQTNKFKNIDEVDLKINNTSIYAHASYDHITVNGIKLYQYTYFALDENFIGFAEIRFNFYANNFHTLTTSSFINSLFIDAGRYHFTINRHMERGLPRPFFYNILTTVKNPNANPTGLIHA